MSQNLGFLAITVWERLYIENIFTHLINNDSACRTLLAIQGLLIMVGEHKVCDILTEIVILSKSYQGMSELPKQFSFTGIQSL